MLSEAGKSYDHVKIINPYNTKQRFRYYQLAPVKSLKKIPKKYETISYNSRQKQNSYLLRYAKDITINTNHDPQFDYVDDKQPRPIFSKAAFERYIGDIRDQDYSVPLHQNCDHRCAHANCPNASNVSQTSKSLSRVSSKFSRNVKIQNLIKKVGSLPLNSLQSDKEQASLRLLELGEDKSTEPSIMKKRSIKQFQQPLPRKEPKKKNRLQGMSFDSSVGHQYLKEVEDRQRYPQVYQIQQSKQSIIRKSMNEPKGFVKFDSFRQKVNTRLDRADPNWNLSIDLSNPEIHDSKAYNFELYSRRKSKQEYKYRVNMNLYEFPAQPNVHINP